MLNSSNVEEVMEFQNEIKVFCNFFDDINESIMTEYN
jgi:hypothetical protein